MDGDTLDVGEVRVRLALVNTPERGDPGYSEERLFTESLCTIGSNATVDEDDGQTEGSFGRMIGLVYCNGKNLNSELLVAGHAHIDPRFCSESEFAKEDWARKSGCQ